jgi:hypothetical protein
MSDVLLVTQKIGAALSACGADWYVGGSLASSAHGTPRATQDVDFVVALQPTHVESLVRALEAEFHIDAFALQRAIASQRSCNIIHLPTMYKADLFVLKDEPFAQEQMRRRLQVALPTPDGEITIWFCSAEDIVLQKLLWYRKGGGLSDQQWRDIAGVLQTQAQLLDQDYLSHWADTLGLRELFDRAVTEAGISFPATE